MRVATISGLAAETVAATPRSLRFKATREDRLLDRDAAVATLMRSGWGRRRLENAFGLSKTQVNAILADIREFAAAYRAAEEDAA